MATIKLFGRDGQEKGTVEVADKDLVLDRGEQAVRDTIVGRAAFLRAGTASTLSKGEVNGSNKKPWKQKGTGRARAGLKQSPVWRGGGVAFGPKPRDFSVKVNKKVAKLAFRRILSDRVADGTLILVEDLSLEQAKTKALVAVLKALKAENAAALKDLKKNPHAVSLFTQPDNSLAEKRAAIEAMPTSTIAEIEAKTAAWEKLKERLAAPAKKETVA